MEITRPDQRKFSDFPRHHSKMNVTSNVTRYSVILPFSTLPFSELTSKPVTPRNVLVARFKPSSAASWKLFFDEAVILLTLATAMTRLLYGVSATEVTGEFSARSCDPPHPYMKNAPRLRNFVIKGAKRLLQHYLPTADIHRWPSAIFPG